MADQESSGIYKILHGEVRYLKYDSLLGVFITYSGMLNNKSDFCVGLSIAGGELCFPYYFQSGDKQIRLDLCEYEVVKVTPDELILKYLKGLLEGKLPTLKLPTLK